MCPESPHSHNEEGLDIPLTGEQQQAEHVLARFLTFSHIMLFKELANIESSSREVFNNISLLLFDLTLSITDEVKTKKSINNLKINIGSKETGQKNARLTKFFNEFTLPGKRNRYVDGEKVILIKYTKIPGLYVKQIQTMNGTANIYLNNYFLIGNNHCPAEFQHSIITEPIQSPNIVR